MFCTSKDCCRKKIDSFEIRKNKGYWVSVIDTKSVHVEKTIQKDKEHSIYF